MPKQLHPLRQRAEYALYRMGAATLRSLPESAVQSFAQRAGALAFSLQGERARWALANLRIAFPEKTEAERYAIGRESYAQFGMNMADLPRAQTWSREELTTRCPIEGHEHVELALARGNGALLLTLHIGNWEVGVQALAFAVEHHKVCVIGRPMRNRLIYDQITSSRTRSGAELIDRENALTGMMRRLRANRPVAVLNDQYVGRARGVFAPFFGVRASTAAGVALLALRTGAAIVPCYSLRLSPGRYAGWFFPEIEIHPTGARNADLIEVASRCNAVLEKAIRAHPEQWLWGHRRFRYSPDLASDPY